MIIMTKGLPGSGKSTWAKEQLKSGNWKRVNKDDLRRMLDDSKWSKKNEQFVLDIRDSIITSALLDGYNVIVDDTNLAPKHEINLRKLAADMKPTYGIDVEFQIKDFTDVPIEECIKRDLLRQYPVGEAVIRKMHRQFLAPKPIKRKEWDVSKKIAILCDLDGTLALFGDANPYDRDFTKDELNGPVADVISRYGDIEGIEVLLLSGRKEKFRNQTVTWLNKHLIFHDGLFMRATDDNRHDYIVKEEIYRREVEPYYNVLFVLDDRNQVVDLWRRLGLTCFQVAEGDF